MLSGLMRALGVMPTIVLAMATAVALTVALAGLLRRR